MPCDQVRAVGSVAAYLLGFVACQRLDGLEWLRAVQARWLDAHHGLLHVKVTCQREKVEDVATMAGHGENRWSATLGLDRHDRSRTALQRFRLPQEGHDLLLLAGQLLPQPCVERTDWSTAFELCVLDPQPDLPGTERREKRGSIHHSSNSSRAPEEDLEANWWFVSTSMSIASESPAIVGLSNRVASSRLTSKVARSRATRPTAVIDCPPRSKKSSWTPIPSTRSSSLQIAATDFAVSVWGGPPSPARALGAGRALRSTFPFGVSGRASRNTNCAGTI